MEQLIEKINQWAEERNLIKGSSPTKQALKFIEELGELVEGINKGKPALIKDALGDLTVVVIILAKMLNLEILDADCFDPQIETPQKGIGVLAENIGYILHYSDSVSFLRGSVCRLFKYLTSLSLYFNYDIKDCLETAYNEIKDRKGKMMNGVFVKEEDLDL